MFLTPFLAVQEQHISPFRPADLHAFKMLLNIIAGIIHILSYNGTQLIYPFLPLLFIGSDQGMHGKNVHTVIVTFLTF